MLVFVKQMKISSPGNIQALVLLYGVVWRLPVVFGPNLRDFSRREESANVMVGIIKPRIFLVPMCEFTRATMRTHLHQQQAAHALLFKGTQYPRDGFPAVGAPRLACD